ncbi:MAG: LptF/LptG family permease [Rickettsiales bacterium]|jgi:lipopolysaccharide export system permease protein|nr:LptF/LptG family permease [Rickettsiales bacterium]
MLFAKLDRYIARILLTKIIQITGAFFLLIFLIDILENSRKLSKTFLLPDLLTLSSIHSLEIIAQILFFTTFLASLFTFLQLARTSEIQVIRTSGITNFRLAKPFLIIVIVMSLLPSVLLSYIGDYNASKTSQSHSNFGTSGLWLKEQNQQNYFLLNLKGYKASSKQLENISIICFKCSDFADNTLIKATNAELSQNKLTLHNITVNQAKELPNSLLEYSFPVSFSQEFFFSYLNNHNKEIYGIFKLIKLIQKSEINGINTLSYRIALHNYLTTPLLFLAIFMLAMILGNIKPRESNIIKIVLIGILINFIIYFVLALIQHFIYLKLGNIFTFIYLPKLILALLLFRQTIIRFK